MITLISKGVCESLLLVKEYIMKWTYEYASIVITIFLLNIFMDRYQLCLDIVITSKYHVTINEEGIENTWGVLIWHFISTSWKLPFFHDI